MTANATNVLNSMSRDALERGYLPQVTLPGAHWFIRIPLALIIANQGAMKFIDLAGGAASYGFPVWMWALAGLGEILAAAAFIIGGIVKSLSPENALLRLFGDVVTRLGGLATTIIVASVIGIVYWGPWQGMQFHLMLLAGGVYFTLRGNRA
ncbi:MAG: hypothetical protein AAF841_13285 [Pseudomonadota bacterium]